MRPCPRSGNRMQPSDSGSPTNEEIERLTLEVLSGPLFTEPVEETRRSLFRQFLDWLDGLHIGSNSVGADLLTLILWIVVVVVVALLIAALVGQVPLRSRAGQRDRRRAVIALEGEADTIEEALSLVSRALAEGDRHRAVWILHRIVLGLLDERGEISFVRWKTNSNYVSEIGSEAEHRELLIGLTRAYEGIVYAGDEDTPVDLATYLDRVRALRSVS